jgi:putative transport protein
MHLLAFALTDLLKPHSVALTVFLVSVAAIVGLGLGSLKFKGLHLGIGGVLFAGLGVGQFVRGDQLNPEVMEFAREFGLILFVYTIGVQVGPGFLASLRREGLPLNLMAAAIVLIGAGVAVVACKVGGVDMRSAVGIFAGATTNTPSLAAAQQALRDTKGAAGGATTGTVAGYAIAYPFGVIGIMAVMVGLRVAFRVDLAAAAGHLAAGLEGERPPLATMTLEVTNANLAGREIRRVPGYDDGDVVVSRVMRDGQLAVATPRTVLRQGDLLLAVGPREALDDLRVVCGRESAADLTSLPSRITTRRVLVTQGGVLGRTVDELDLSGRLGVSVTRIRRSGVELPPSPGVGLQFGDVLLVVGEEPAIAKAAQILGDSAKRLDHPQIIPIFLGLALGVVLGSVPISFPGMPAPVKMGLAGGPLIVAIVLSRLGHFGPLVWYLPASANFILREVGIVLFLACVGIKSGGEFFQTLLHGPGLQWMAWGALVTAVPLVAVGLFARLALKLNYMSLCGLLAGSMTDPPALAFAGTVTASEAPGVSYAAVYPLVMLLRVLVAQGLVLAFV